MSNFKLISLTTIAGLSLLVGATACSTDDAKDAGSSATSVGTEAGSTVSSAITPDKDKLPQAISDFADAHSDLGELKSVDTKGDNTLATFDNGWVTYSEETGAVPLIGKIGETWTNDGGLDNELGLPVSAEVGNYDQGWTQEFQNGTLDWLPQGNDEFAPVIALNES